MSVVKTEYTYMVAITRAEYERLRAEVERLTTSYGTLWVRWQSEIGALWNKEYALRAENEKLRAALHRIGLPLAQITYCRDGHEEAVLIARAALEERT